MAVLNVGRVGLDVQITDPGGVSSWSSQSSDGRTETISGYLRSSSLAETEALRTELLEQRNRLIAVTWTGDASMDGFYIQTGASVGARVDQSAFTGVGFHPFSVTLQRVGSEGSTEFQSLITSAVLTNDFGVDIGEALPFLAPPVGHVAFKSNATNFPTQRQRTTADSATALDWYDDIDPASDPSWSCPPANYYLGAAKVYVSGRLRAGLDAPNDPGDWQLDNGLIKITPSGGGTSNGRINIAVYNGTTWDSDTTFSIYSLGSTEIPEWHYISILENTPEVVRFRLLRDANDTESSRAWYLDINLRRGAMWAGMICHWNGAAKNIQVRHTTNTACTAITPAGATGAVGMRATANDGDGNRTVLASPDTQTQDLTNGRIMVNTINNLKFMVGVELDGSGAATGDTATDLISQWLGHVSEVVRAVPR